VVHTEWPCDGLDVQGRQASDITGCEVMPVSASDRTTADRKAAMLPHSCEYTVQVS
jgi:hypothetical protein